ncbi:uncharacterized protein F4812DRAFT_338067 [Daldinia caldariorum]|uniref:uncharacterized protein n=1 Tax=Daldinia caldariorum TaxID=326644 RepID=UPI0020075022|nr:uncharacterized protein F4812DRAFT_338067 [Daldinia caldariorum]KAI1468648.1 hypothetical protein F4812DRAFT_338067 [Daldinia caldariorum]
MSPNLTTIPLEILIQVTSYLDTRDYAAVRLVCRKLEFLLFRPFAQKYFTLIWFMRTEYDLQALVDISESRLSPYLKHVLIEEDIFCWGVFKQRENDSYFINKTLKCLRLVSPRERLKFLEFAAEQSEFLSTGRDRELLIKAFRNLQLETVEIRGLPFFGHYKIRSSGTYKAYKKTRLHNRFFTHPDLRPDLQPDLFEWDLFAKCAQSVLLALVDSRARPRRFKIYAMLPAMNGRALNIPDFPEDAVQSMASSLETMEIEIDSDRPPGLEYPFNSVISHATHLKKLRIVARVNSEFIQWLGAPVSHNGYNIPPPALTELHHCSLRGCNLPMLSLLYLIQKCSSLRRLVVFDVECLDFRMIDDLGSDEAALVRLLKKILQSSTHLEFICLVKLNLVRWEKRVVFSRNNGPLRPSFIYKGENMKEELEELKIAVEAVE